MSKNIIPLDFIDPPFGPHEPHFRRGFHHGAAAAVDALKSGVSLEELDAFVEAEVRAWRRHSEKPSFPPEPGESNRI